ncbi:MAG: hypothetical protein PHW87_06575, partial [Methanothrix sp.]|nr:hypothetical protein [Methanothrix sp.]
MKGSGSAEMAQKFFGHGGKADWVAINFLKAEGASSINDASALSLEVSSSNAWRRASILNAYESKTALMGFQDGNFAGAVSQVKGGSLFDRQYLSIDGTVSASQSSQMSGLSGKAKVIAGQKDGFLAWTKTDFENGALSGDQYASSDGINAWVLQETSLNSERGSASVFAQSRDGSKAYSETAIPVNGISLYAKQEALAGNRADITDVSGVIGDSGSSHAYAQDPFGNRVEINDTATMSQGLFSSVKQITAEPNNANVFSDLEITRALSSKALSSAETSGGDLADTETKLVLTDGDIKTIQSLKADGLKAAIDDRTHASAVLSGSANSLAVDSDGNSARTGLELG